MLKLYRAAHFTIGSINSYMNAYHEAILLVFGSTTLKILLAHPLLVIYRIVDVEPERN